MTTPTVARDAILNVMCAALEPLETALALWEAGSTAFGRGDEHSDVDLMLIVDDDGVEAAFSAADRALVTLGPIERRYRLPQPTAHGHDQCFYRLRDASPWLLVDLVVLRRSHNPEAFLVRERHGEPAVQFDKVGLATSARLDWTEHASKVAARRVTATARFALFSSFVTKELARGRKLDAMWVYQHVALPAAVDLARIAHCPERFDFGMRYLGDDLPTELCRELEELAYVADAADLERKLIRLERLVRELVDE